MNIKYPQFFSETFLIPRRMGGEFIINIRINDLPMIIKCVYDAVLFADDTIVLENIFNQPVLNTE